MFLDEELLSIVRKSEINKSGEVPDVYISLCRACENYFKSQLKDNMTKKQLKVVLDRTFNLWDSFVRSAIKEGGDVAIIGQVCGQYSFKDMFLENEQMAKIYNDL